MFRKISLITQQKSPRILPCTTARNSPPPLKEGNKGGKSEFLFGRIFGLPIKWSFSIKSSMTNPNPTSEIKYFVPQYQFHLHRMGGGKVLRSLFAGFLRLKDHFTSNKVPYCQICGQKAGFFLTIYLIFTSKGPVKWGVAKYNVLKNLFFNQDQNFRSISYKKERLELR